MQVFPLFACIYTHFSFFGHDDFQFSFLLDYQNDYLQPFTYFISNFPALFAQLRNVNKEPRNGAEKHEKDQTLQSLRFKA